MSKWWPSLKEIYQGNPRLDYFLIGGSEFILFICIVIYVAYCRGWI